MIHNCPRTTRWQEQRMPGYICRFVLMARNKISGIHPHSWRQCKQHNTKQPQHNVTMRHGKSNDLVDKWTRFVEVLGVLKHKHQILVHIIQCRVTVRCYLLCNGSKINRFANHLVVVAVFLQHHEWTNSFMFICYYYSVKYKLKNPRPKIPQIYYALSIPLLNILSRNQRFCQIRLSCSRAQQKF